MSSIKLSLVSQCPVLQCDANRERVGSGGFHSTHIYLLRETNEYIRATIGGCSIDGTYCHMKFFIFGTPAYLFCVH